MKHINFGNDGNFCEELIRHLNDDLSNNIGNLVQGFGDDP